MTEDGYKLHTRTQHFVDTFLFRHHRMIRSMLRRHLRDQPPRVVVEIGSGAKPKDRLFAEVDYISTDLEPRIGIDLVQTATHLTFRDGAVDLVICENVLEHVSEPQRAVEEIRRILRAGGHLFLVTPFLFPLHDVPFDFFRYTQYGLRTLLHNYSNVVIEKVLWLPKPKKIFERFVLYYVCIACK